MLQISALDASTLDGLVDRLLSGTPFGANEMRPALRRWMSEHLEMGVVGERVRAGVDGEPVILEAPLRFSVEPGALRVLLPEGLPEEQRVPPPVSGLRAARTLRQWLRPTLAEQESASDDPHSRMAPSGEERAESVSTRVTVYEHGKKADSPE
jgi:hypothetical protein